MARGWESKSVEAQQAEASEKSAKGREKLSPEAAALARERDVLVLSRKRVLQQMEAVRDSRHQQVLKEALADLDMRLRRLTE